MNSSLAGILQIVLLVVALAVFYKPLGDYIARIFTSEKHYQAGARPLPGDGHRPRRGPAVGHLRALAAGVLRGLRALPLPARAGTALAAVLQRDGQRQPGHRLEHRRLVRHQHELAELLGRVHHGLRRPDGRPRGAELRVRGGRHRGRDRADPRLHAEQDRPAGQLLGRRDPGHHPAADPVLGHRRHHLDGHRRDRQLQPHERDPHAVRRHADDGRRPGRLAGGHQGAREQRRRVLQRELGAPVREPEPVLRLVRDLPAARHPVRALPHLRQDGQGQPAGLPAGRRDGVPLAGRGRRHQLLRMAARGHRPAAGRRRDGGQGSPVRHPRIVALRRVDHGHVHRGGEQFPRFVHRVRRRDRCCST